MRLAFSTVRVETHSEHSITSLRRRAYPAVSPYQVSTVYIIYADGYKYTDCAYHTFDILQEFSNYANVTDVELESERYCGTLLAYFD